MTSFEDLLAQLESAGSVDALLRRVPPELAAMLDRCAWVRSFDAEVFKVLREGAPDVIFDDVVACSDVRPVAGREGTYRLRREAREKALARLLSGGEVPQPLRELSGRLAAHFKDRGRARDELDHLIVADPPEAIVLLRKLYAAADRNFDAPSCQALLDLVHARGSLGGWAVVAEQNRLERYLVARVFWRDKYRLASRFLPPRGTQQAFEGLLAENGPNRLQFFADGGMGKTLHLYELIARQAVPEPRRLFCALVDFDLTQLGNVLREPWLVLPEIAHQLNQQLDEPVFDDFLKRYGRVRARLLLPQFAVAASVPGQVGDVKDEERERLRDNVRREFFAVIAQPSIARRVMIVFDTLEVITHAWAANAPGAAGAFVEELTTLSQRLPEARIVLSGRYDLRHEIEGFERRLGPVEHVELRRLDADEARRYLRTRRKLHSSEAVIEAAIAAAGAGVEGAQPLMLAMIADAIAQEPTISADVVRKLDEPRLYYLIQRIVVRIPDPRVRWLLRYGVVPRLLSRRFVADVAVPFLQTAIRRTTPDDDPTRDHQPAGAATTDAFPVNPDAHLDVDELWAQLSRYATAYSWVELVETDVLRFHEVVVEPMRALLREQPVFVKLNEAASAYFERRAEELPDERARLLRDAFYHRIVIDVDRAIAEWQHRTHDLATDPEVAAALAEEVLDLAVREPTRLPRDVIARARVERALANLRRATAPGALRGSGLWDLAREDVEQASSLLAADDVRLAACRAALLVHDGDQRGALAVATVWLRRELRPSDELILHVRRGDALALTGAAGDADAEYRAAIELGRRGVLRDVDVATLHWKRAKVLDGRDDLDAARAACEHGLAIAPDQTAARAALLLLRGALDLRAGMPSASSVSIDVPLSRGDRLSHEARLLLAVAELARWAPERALHTAEGAVADTWSRRAETAEAGIELAEAREIRARAHAALGDSSRAQEDLEAAAMVWDSIAGGGARRCFAEIAKVQLRHVGDLHRADAALSRAEAITAERDVVDHGCVRLRRAEYLAWGGVGDPTALVTDVIDELHAVQAPPGVRARAALEGLCLPRHEPGRPFLLELNRALAEIRPVDARLAILEDLERCPPLTGLPRPDLEPLRELLASPELRTRIDGYTVPDRRVALVRLADVARVTGDLTQSRRLLDVAHALGSDAPETAFVRLKVALAAVRADHTELAESIGVPERGALALPQHSGRPAPPIIDAARELLGDDRIRDVAIGVLWSAVTWSALRLLEDPTALVETARRVQGRGRPAPAQAPSEHPTLDVFLRVDGSEFVIRAVPPWGGPRVIRIGSDHPVVRAVVRATARPAELDPQLAELFQDRAIVWPGMAELLLTGWPSEAGIGDGAVDLRLWTDGAPLAMVPWELAAHDDGMTLLSGDPRVRVLYRGLPSPPAEHVPPERLTVTIIRPEVRNRRYAPGMIRTTLVPIEKQYEAAGMRVRIVESVELESLIRVFADCPPDIVHIAAGFVDAGGGAVVDISSGVAGQIRLTGINSHRLTATGFASAVTAAGGVRPVLVLDPPAVSHAHVQAAQLLLRNAFAAEVAVVAAVPAVIATGLVRYSCQDDLYRRLPRELAAGHPVAAVVEGIRGLARDVSDAADAFGFSSTALFTARPEHRMVSGR